MQAPTAVAVAATADIPKNEIDMVEKLHVVPPSESKSSAVDEEAAFDNYPIVAAIAGWDQIRSLTLDVSTSVLAKQASIICERFREENKEPAERPSKRRKIGTPSSEDSSSEDGNEDNDSEDNSSEQQQGTQQQEPQAVSCDDQSSTSSSSSSAEEPATLPGCVSHQVDRMARMSKLMLNMESCHRAVRMEMIAMAKDSGIDLEFP
jgi:hypothetical protein